MDKTNIDKIIQNIVSEQKYDLLRHGKAKKKQKKYVHTFSF